MDEKEILENQVLKLFEVLYAKGRLDYETDFRTNDVFFRLRKNPKAYLFTIEVTIDMDKFLPSSKDYDPTYVKLINNLHKTEDAIPRYLGEPNLVFNVEFIWDEERLNNVTTEPFNKITNEVATNFFNSNKDKLVRMNISSPEKFVKVFEFEIFPIIRTIDAKLFFEVHSVEMFCKWFSTVGFFGTYVEPVIEKYGYGDYPIENYMCDSQV